MNKAKNYHDGEFIGRWAAGALSADEQQAFERWLAENPAEQKQFAELREVWQISAQMDFPPVQYADVVWDAVSKQTIKKAPNITPLRRPVWPRFVAVAAAVIILLGFYGWWQSARVFEISVPSAAQLIHTLPDGSQVTINAASSIRYHKSSFMENRQIELDGEAFFEVKPGIQFRVLSGFAVTEALGTSFNVKAWGKKVAVTCASGKVQVSSSQLTASPVILTPGFGTVVAENQPPQPPQSQNAKQLAAWRDGEFHFISTPLAEVFAEIERQFAVQIEVKKSARYLVFTGQFDKNDVRAALDIVCLSSGLSYALTAEKQYVIR